MKKILPFIILHAIVLMYSLTGIFSKTAAGKDFLSFEWIMLYGCLIFFLGVYAILWQQVLKKIPLNVAYANKAVAVIWGMVWGVIVFGETITLKHIIGALIVIAGVVLMVTGEKKKDDVKGDDPSHE